MRLAIKEKFEAFCVLLKTNCTLGASVNLSVLWTNNVLYLPLCPMPMFHGLWVCPFSAPFRICTYKVSVLPFCQSYCLCISASVLLLSVHIVMHFYMVMYLPLTALALPPSFTMSGRNVCMHMFEHSSTRSQQWHISKLAARIGDHVKNYLFLCALALSWSYFSVLKL